MKSSRNKILVTGGATGIGRGLAERFFQNGNTVIVCGRREAVLQQLAAEFPGMLTRVCDLEQTADREAMFQWIAAEHADLNVLVNNAGIQNWMKPGDPAFADLARKEVSINIEAPIHLTELFLRMPNPQTIVNVTSGLAFVPFAKVPVYSATKAFFHSFTQSLRYLLKDRKVEVVEIIPPALKTDLGGPGLHDHAPGVGEFIDSIFKQWENGQLDLSHGFSEAMTKAGPAEVKAAFDRLNP